MMMTFNWECLGSTLRSETNESEALNQICSVRVTECCFESRVCPNIGTEEGIQMEMHLNASRVLAMRL